MFVSLKDEGADLVACTEKKGKYSHCEKVDIKTPGTVRRFSVPYHNNDLLEYVASTSLWQASFTEERLFTKIVTIQPAFIIVNKTKSVLTMV